MAWPVLRAQVAFDSAPLATPSWTTIHVGSTRRVLSAHTKMGRNFELSPFEPGTLELDLDNADRKFDPANTSGTYYGKLLPRKRIRLQADWGTYLDCPGTGGAGGGTGDAPEFDITGDIDLRARISADDWTPSASGTICGKADVTGQFSYSLALDSTGKLGIASSPNGTLAALLASYSTVAVPFSAGEIVWVRATLDVNNGAGGRTAKFYWSRDQTPDHSAVTWTQLGATVTTAGTTSIHAGTAPPSIGNLADGYSQLAIRCYAVAFLNGIDGTVVAAPVFTDGNRFTAGALYGSDPQGHDWYRGGAGGTFEAVTYDLFSGFVDRWPQDQPGAFAGTAQVTATDAFKMLAGIEVASAYEETMRGASPRSWWRMGDAVPDERACLDSSGNHRDGVYYGGPGSVASLVAGATGDAVEFDGSDDRVIFDSSAVIAAAPFTVVAWVKTSTANTDTAIVYLQYKLVGIPGGGQTFQLPIGLCVTGAGLAQFTVRTVGPTSVALTGATDLRDGRPHMIVGTVDGSSVPRLYVDGALAATGSALGSLTLDTSDGARIATGPVGGSGYVRFTGTIDEVAVYSSALSGTTIAAQYDAGADPWAGDLPGPRIGRFLDIAGWPSADRDIETGSAPMGPFDSDGTTVLDAIQDAEATEAGCLWVAPSGKVTFRARHSRALDPRAVNPQAVFTDDSAAAAPLHPTECVLDFSDELIANKVTVEWSGGTEVVQDATSIAAYGVRGSTVSTSLASSVSARSRGQWVLSRYAQPRVRPEKVTIRPSADHRLWWPALTLRIGDRVTVRRRPGNTGSVTTLTAWVESIEHSMGDGINRWETTFGLSPTPDGVDGPGGPAIPNTFILGDPVYGRLGLNSLG